MDLTVRESPLVRAISSPGERRSKKGRSWRCDAWGGSMTVLKWVWRSRTDALMNGILVMAKAAVELTSHYISLYLEDNVLKEAAEQRLHGPA